MLILINSDFLSHKQAHADKASSRRFGVIVTPGKGEVNKLMRRLRFYKVSTN